jgi:DNA modification methylase
VSSKVRQGDCLEIMRGLGSQSADLIYVDPPFFTQKMHTLMTRDRAATFQFSDEWRSLDEYLNSLRKRAHAWTFNLQKKLEGTQLRIEPDTEVEEVLAQPEQQEFPEKVNATLA